MWMWMRMWAAMAHKLIPIMIGWPHGGRTVYLTGTFNNWRQKIRLSKSTDEFSTIVDMAAGTHRFKFIVDDEWKCSEDLPIASDPDGNLVNYLEVVDEEGDQQGDGLDGLSRLGDEPGPPIRSESPVESYTSTIPSYLEHGSTRFRPNPNRASTQSTASTALDHSQRSPGQHASHLLSPSYSPEQRLDEPIPLAAASGHAANGFGPPFDPPPSLPPHMQRVLLNSKTITSDPYLLPVPTHVTLNHLYACSIRDGVMAIGVTSRYRKKYVTTVLYKPVFS
ncbi:hypothetical protein BC831DRAFT_482021 [Entophlyctis helioformis]|nr:hypothetical protein BC831DRAFT_482021 [Entophlyctis helioformis]